MPSILLLFLFLYLGYGQSSVISDLQTELNNNPVDPSSFSRSDRFVTTHLKWKAIVSFEKQIIEGVVELSIKKLSNTTKLVLDTQDLTIHQIKDKDTNKTLKFELSPALKVFGSKLTVELLNKSHSNISISYKTNPNATALQWLLPQKIKGRKHPALFSQLEAIHGRSIIPLQDSPSIKFTYEATVVVPKNMTALMSALHEGTGKLSTDGLTKEYRFKQPVPMPSYLIALVVGTLESRKVGPRSHVWSEPDLIERSAFEFADTEKLLATAESIMGPYVWGVYDLLILPPSFPYGGMENPCLTFVTSNLLVGDRSLANVIAHEIAHSWTGNMVTNKKWADLWLNEGFATFIERKVLGRLKGEAYREFRAIKGLNSLKNLVNHMGANNSMTKLVMDMRGVNPDSQVTSAPYEKGHTFLFYLEQLLGGPKAFEPFIREYIKKFKYTSIDSNDFKSFLNQYFKDMKHILETIDWDLWLHSTGMPPIIPKYDDSLIKVSTELAHRWITANDSKLAQFTAKDISSMDAWQVMDFLNLLLQTKPPLDAAKVIALTHTYSSRSKNNAQIRHMFLNLCLRAHMKDCVGEAISFVSTQGKTEFLESIYKGLYDWEETRNLAIDTFKANRAQYMHSAVVRVSEILNLE